MDLRERLQHALGADYAVERQLGAGGFAVVFLVTDTRLKRKLAVKVLSPDVIASHSALERFRREAQTIAQLSHPNIVPLHFVGEQDDLVYLVMEAVEGGSLAERLGREGRIPVADAIPIMRDVAAALGHAHKRGVVHRDIKPHNVLLDQETGRALVTDFGIARTASAESLTATGIVMGTPSYLSPEQVTGEASDQRSDIYAFGVMAYEMLAGQPPFAGAQPFAVLTKRLAGPPPPLRKLRPDVPPSVEDLIDACLAVEPADRPQDAGEVARLLSGELPTLSAGRVGRRRWTTAAKFATLAAFASFVALGAIAYARFRQPPPARPQAVVDSGMVLIPGGSYVIGTDSGDAVARPAHHVTLSPFGIDAHEVTVAAYARFANSGAVQPRWMRRLAGDSAVPVTGVRWSEATRYCAWRYPNGGRLPTEEEWEAAARGPDARVYPWGNAWDSTAANTRSSGRGGPTPVGAYPRGNSPPGVQDLIGNVWEWTSSPFRRYGQLVPAAATSYVIRGGAYNSYDRVSAAWFRAEARADAPRDHLASTGFRCAMDARISLR